MNINIDNMDNKQIEIFVNMYKYSLNKIIYIKDGKRFMDTLDCTFVWDCNREIWLFYSRKKTDDILTKKVANNFYDWLIDLGYRDTEDKEEDFKEVLKDFTKVKEVAPRLFNLIRDISDR